VETLEEALQQALMRVDRVLAKAHFWQQRATTVLNKRQIRVLNRLLDTSGDAFEQGINARQYKALANVSKVTATRDLIDLLEKNCLQKLPGGGRSTRYAIAWKLQDKGRA
jgi:Fic family protein